MGNQETSWIMKSGINPKFYARLYEALKLGNKGTEARVKNFNP